MKTVMPILAILVSPLTFVLIGCMSIPTPTFQEVNPIPSNRGVVYFYKSSPTKPVGEGYELVPSDVYLTPYIEDLHWWIQDKNFLMQIGAMKKPEWASIMKPFSSAHYYVKDGAGEIGVLAFLYFIGDKITATKVVPIEVEPGKAAYYYIYAIHKKRSPQFDVVVERTDPTTALSVLRMGSDWKNSAKNALPDDQSFALRVPASIASRPPIVPSEPAAQSPSESASASPPIAAPAPKPQVVRDGSSPETAIVLARRTVKLDGKPESWERIRPILETGYEAKDFLGSPDYNLKVLYLCRDEKFLYWRIDFNEVNPLKSPPKILRDKLFAQLCLNYDPSNNLNSGMNYYPAKRNSSAFLSSWDTTKRINTNVPSTTATVASGKDTLVGRIPMSLVNKYCKDPIEVWFEMGTDLGAQGKAWTHTRRIYIDPTK